MSINSQKCHGCDLKPKTKKGWCSIGCYRKNQHLVENSGRLQPGHETSASVREKISKTSKQRHKDNPEWSHSCITAMTDPKHNHKKSHKGSDHPNFGKKYSDERKRKQSETISNLILEGKFNTASCHKKGWITHNKIIGGKMYFRSSYEETFTQDLINDANIISIENEPFKIPYGNKHYIPDFLISHTNGIKYLVEVKPENLVPHNHKKIKAGQKFADDNKMTFVVVTEKVLFNEGTSWY